MADQPAIGGLPALTGKSWMVRASVREVDPMKAHAHARTEISPAVAMLVVVLVLSMAAGVVLYSLQHSSVEIAAPTLRSRAAPKASRGVVDTESKPAPVAKHRSGEPVSQKR